jgi:inhibitor of cysteine peptidase
MAGRRFLSLVRITALVAAGLMFAISAAGGPYPERVPQTMLILVESDNGRTVDVHVGTSVRINLPENATTGYRWAIDHYDEEFIEALASEPRYTEKAIGSGGEVTFIFQGKKIGSGGIALKLWRHWEGEASVTNRFRIRLKVQP